ncbi:MAG: SDR family NAD(P)-dependent oxidoreductase, partial [Methyloligellaceae bacterium]
MTHPVFSEGRAALVTGAASGIGLAACNRFASLGMKVCLADINESALEAARDEVASSGADVLAVVSDVSDRASIKALKDKVLKRFGEVALLMNNAVTRLGGGV